MLDKRLSACAELIRPDVKVCDVGTDHAYLPCFLVESQKNTRVIAADINEKPLAGAQKHIDKCGFSNQIQTVLSDGLQEIRSEDADDIVVAGMGGELIARILFDCSWVKDSTKHFVLQPMTNVPVLRKLLYQNGFQIEREIPVIENGHYYTVILCIYCAKPTEISELFSIVGKIPSENTPERNAYLSYQAFRMKKIADGFRRSQKSKLCAEQYDRLSEEINRLINNHSAGCKNMI